MFKKIIAPGSALKIRRACQPNGFGLAIFARVFDNRRGMERRASVRRNQREQPRSQVVSSSVVAGKRALLLPRRSRPV